MLGVLVDELSAPLDSLTSGPMCDNVSTSLPSTRAEDVQRVSSPSRSFPSDLDGEVYTFGRFMPNQSSLSISTLHALEFCSSPPSSPSDKGSPRMQGFDGRDEFGRKSFSRCLSKLGGQGLMPVSEDLAYGDLPLEMVGSEVVGDANVSLSSPPGISIPMASAYANSCGGAMVGSPVLTDAISALQKYLPSNNEDEELWPPQTDSWPPSGDVYSCDEFRMYEFKVRRCMRGRSHDWTECPFAHPGEKARRRDPRRFHYSGTACPDFRKGTCQRGDACEFAHGVFECWLHPARYRTQPCKDGRNCKRRVCFFAHTNDQLRVLPGVTAQTGSPSPRASLHSPSLKASLGASYDGSPLRQALAGSFDGAMTLESLSCLGQHGFFDLPFEGHVGSPRSGYLSFAGKCAHGGFCGNLSQISSPTSTLAGHTLSPPPLSPPLSPSESPPMSPNIPSSWSSALARSMSCHSSSQVSLSQPISAASLHASISPAALSHVHTSIEASTQNSGSLSTAITLGPSPSLATTPGHRSQFERLHARPTVTTILTPEGRQAPHGQSCQVMTGLIATFQQLEPRARVTTEPSHFCTRWSPSTGLLHSALGVRSASTKTRWSGQVDPWDISEGEVDPPLERVESGRDLRAKIYGRLCKENPLENEGPDIDWVNEIVK